MNTSMMTKILLAFSGLIAVGVGIGVLFLPHAFHASAGISVGGDVNLLNELRSPGAMILLAGAVILVGAFRSRLTVVALILSTAVYLSFGLSRIVSVVADGIPNAAMLQILGLELFIGGMSALLLYAVRGQNLRALQQA
ncbi:DUF4345 domain-containing protein [Sulfitobacter sp. M368]|jgi:uncharacterized protein DUF4345|uniref:DUF4345 domain-containing protein n=1 Tax=Sulfitobacter sp. M368 TaxID=2867021 RepID=UPI0021A59924|nr:DUF4345 domain-containing protein [Sulfitobacter sp. M368]UWR16346.1 DUF4345 domain-containing protein [Sulfitobacter sp. M368]